MFHGVVCLHFAWCGRDVSVHDGVGGKLLGCVRDGVVVALCPRCAVAFLSTRCQLCEGVVPKISLMMMMRMELTVVGMIGGDCDDESCARGLDVQVLERVARVRARGGASAAVVRSRDEVAICCR